MAEYSKCFFDAAGHLDERQRMAQLCAGAKMLDVFGQSDWEELYRHEYIKPHQWEPNEGIQTQLRLILAKEGVDF
jgi:hypothetical protein